MTEVELQKQRQAATNAAQLATIQQSSAYQGDHAALLSGGGGAMTPQKGQTDFSQWAASQAAQGPRQDAAFQATEDRRRASEDATWLPQGFDRHEQGYSKVIGGMGPAAGTGSGTPAVDAGGTPSGGAGDGLSASMASLTGAPAAGQALQEPGGSLLRPTLVTRHPAVLSASLAQLGKAY